MTLPRLGLPIEPVLPAIGTALTAGGSLVLEAPPGAGKTTLVPLSLLGAPWLRAQRIVMLEPRRLATRAAARRMAELLGERTGETVGYRMRGETQVGRNTRIEVVTEGVLTRRLQRDPTLEDIGLVIFDEFHERSLDADLGLALTLRSRELVRDDLRILVMSATLDGAPVAALLGDVPVISSEGRTHEVATRYLPPRAEQRLEASVVGAIEQALRNDTGDILAFLPGAGEIRRVETVMAGRYDDVIVAPLYGSLPAGDQDRALRPDPERRRKVVLSTSIAETSLTIEGIRVVIDAGWSRVPRFSPLTGMTRLDTVRVSRASANQRRGRAGRLGPGVCYRLWPEHEDHHLLDATPPEIANADLAPLALDLAAAGVDDPLELAWLDPPSPAAFTQARELLTELEALDPAGRVTPHGREIAALPVHPRLGHMLVRSKGQREQRLACEVAALLSDRDFVRSSPGSGHVGVPDVDLALRVEALRGAPPWSGADDRFVAAFEIDVANAHRARREADRLERQLVHASGRSRGPSEVASQKAALASNSLDSLGPLVALAYPDRVAQRRPGHRARYTLRNGRGAELDDAQSLSQAPYLVVAEVDDRRPESRIFRAARLTLDDIRATFTDQIVERDIVEFDEASGAVLTRRRELLGALVLREVTIPIAEPGIVLDALMAAIRRRGTRALPWSDAAVRLRQRIAFVARNEAGWPDVSDSALEARLDEWLAPVLAGVRRLSDVGRIDLAAALGSLLDWRQRAALDTAAPTHLEVPSGSRIPIDYTDPEAPVLAVRIQEVFGMTDSPRLLHGRVPLTLHLLSPAHRPVQVTRDLAGFWRTGYFDVRKDLRGRYPKHDWPEDPLSATPTHRTKRRHR